jgi:hypothetical protein
MAPGYGVVSFGTKDLAWVKTYVREQRRHHAQGHVHDRLEKITSDENSEAQADQSKPRERGREDGGSSPDPLNGGPRRCAKSPVNGARRLLAAPFDSILGSTLKLV